MKKVVGILVCSLGMLTLHLMSPDWWWVMAVPLLYGGLMARSGREAFLVAAAGGALVWGAGSAGRLIQGGEIVARRVAEMIGLGEPWILVPATALIAALAAGLAAATGFQIGRLGRQGIQNRSGGDTGVGSSGNMELRER